MPRYLVESTCLIGVSEHFVSTFYCRLAIVSKWKVKMVATDRGKSLESNLFLNQLP